MTYKNIYQLITFFMVPLRKMKHLKHNQTNPTKDKIFI